jgi:hypothetical protein
MRADDIETIQHADMENQFEKDNPEYMCHIDLNDMNYSHSQTLSSNALGVYQFSKGLKYASIISFFANLALVLFNKYYVFFVLCTLWGYFSSLSYRPWMVLSYFIYTIVNMVIRFGINTYDSVEHFAANDITYGTFNMIWGVILMGSSIYGLRLIWRLYTKLIICTEEEKLQLRNIRTLNLKALF